MTRYSKSKKLEQDIRKSKKEYDELVDNKLEVTPSAVANILENRLQTSLKLDSAVIPFASEACPPGWKNYKDAYGRFIRAIDKSGKNVDPDGYRKPGMKQEDGFKAHPHYKDGRNVNSVSRNWKANSRGGWKDTGIEETRPKNVAFLFCIKDKESGGR